MKKVTKGLLAIAGAFAIVGFLGYGLNTAVAADKIVVDKDGVTVKLTNVVAESVNTGMVTAVNGGNFSAPVIFQLNALPAKLEELINRSGADTTSLTQVEGTFCFVTFVSYKDALAGQVDVPIASECKSFSSGVVLGTVVSFAEDYTKEVTNTYKTKFQVLK